jgi:hypothetical protein
MTKELSNQIEGMIEHYLDEFLDAYQCQDWGINAEAFATYLSDEFNKKVLDFARDVDTSFEEDS